MQPEERNAAYLWDMLEAAREVVAFTAGISYHAYANDRMRQRAVERAVEIIGEAARQVSADLWKHSPRLPVAH